jgi:hypothetical protein
MHRHALRRLLAFAAPIAIIAVSTVRSGAQDAQPAPPLPGTRVPQPPDASDPPSIAGRLAYIEGAVSFRPAAGDTWALASTNRALTTGDRLWVDSVGRAEVGIGANALRLSTETEADLVRLDDQGLQVRVPQGSVTLRLKSIGAGGVYEIDAPNSAVSLGQEGEYRVDVSPDGLTTKVTVWAGQARVTAAGSSFDVDAHKTATVHGDSTPTYDITDAGAPDPFDQWSQAQDAREDRPSASSRYVAADIGGLPDLDDNGSWASDPAYGAVWYPSAVAEGWAPYHFGHWVWEGPWGWVWVEDEPWGWAPFHYGRWAYIGSRWGWCPGPLVGYRSVFAPGLVGFVGGAGWSVGVGWFPLGPGEPYFPGYGVGFAYRARLNIGIDLAHVDVATFNYRNRGIPGAVIAVPRDAFARGEPVARVAIHVAPADIARARVVGMDPGVVPTREALAPLGGRAAAPPAGIRGRAVVALHAPPPRAVPFAAQVKTLSTNGGRPLTRTQMSTLRAQTPAATPVRSAAISSAHSLTPARAGLPAAQPVFGTRAVAVPTGRSSTGTSSLDREYQTEQQSMEARHTQEFAKQPANTDMQALTERQEAEHQDLQQRYNSAKVQNSPHMEQSHFSAPSRGGGGGGGGRRP